MPALRRAAPALRRLPAPLLRRHPRIPHPTHRGRPLSSSAAAAPRCELEYYSAWFCPFAHRATLALEHHAPSGVDYNWIEALGWSKKDEEELDENSGVRGPPPRPAAAARPAPALCPALSPPRHTAPTLQPRKRGQHAALAPTLPLTTGRCRCR